MSHAATSQMISGSAYFRQRSGLEMRLQAFGKRGMDIAGALVLLLIIAPVLLLIAAAIKLDSPGPVMFRQPRAGRNGQNFDIFKFRTMRAEKTDVACKAQTTRNDPRITKLGAILRRHSLDELPQLFNVLLGDMSLVGPRPHATTMLVDGRRPEDIIDLYPLRHAVRPGITGWAQVNGNRGILDNGMKLARRVELDLEYINRWSVWFDLYVLLKTVRCAFSDPDAF